MKINKLFTLGLAVLLLAGCGQVLAGYGTPGSLTLDSGTKDEPPANSEGSIRWIESRDERTGVGFAVPCFWEVNIPAGAQDPSGLGAFSIRNYNEAFVMAHPKEAGLWESGALQVDIGYVRPSTFGLSPNTSLSDVAHALVEGEYSEFEVAGTGYVTINGQPGLLVATGSKADPHSSGRFYLFALASDLYMTFSAAPAGALEHPDVQGVLYSLALNVGTGVHVPNVLPSAPPVSVPAACLKGIASS